MRLLQNRYTGEIKEWDETMDSRLWAVIDEPPVEPATMTLQRFHAADEFRKEYYYKFFPWTRKENRSGNL